MKIVDMVKNPFKGKVSMITHETKELTFILDIRPIYPDIVPKVGLFLAIVGLVFNWWILTIGGFALSMTFFFWTKYFFYLMIKLSRKKQGIKGTIVLVPLEDCLRGVLFSWGK